MLQEDLRINFYTVRNLIFNINIRKVFIFFKNQYSITEEAGELNQMQKTSISEKECRTENFFFF